MSTLTDEEPDQATLAKSSLSALVLTTIGTGVLLVFGLMILVLLRCYNCYKWSKYQRQRDEESGLNGKTTIQISHSLPDLTQDMAKHEYFVQNVNDTINVKKVSQIKSIYAGCISQKLYDERI